MFDKIKNLFNVKAWMETLVKGFILKKGVKHATSAVIGLISGVFFSTKVKPILDQMGITIDPIHLAEGLTVFLSGLAGSLMNWGVKAMYKDEPEVVK